MSNFLEQCQLPREIRRPARSLEHLARWKGTEFRTFLLYLSPIILNHFFDSEDISEHFLNFYCAIQICSRNDQGPENLAVARSLINDFLEGVKLLYGNQLFCSNMHNLGHLVDDVERFGPLGSFDAYPFESRLYTLKRLIRSGNLPLSQVSKRITEIQTNLSRTDIAKSGSSSPPVLKKICKADELEVSLKVILEKNNWVAYSFIDLHDYVLDTNSDSNKWILMSTLDVVRVDKVVHDPSRNAFYLYGNVVSDLRDFFVKPLTSSSLFIYASDLNLKPPEVFELKNIRGKMVKIGCNKSDLPKCVFIPLIHTLK